MNDIPMFGRRQKSSRIRDSREQSLSIRVTKNEEKILLAAAEKNQQPLREWLRDVALKAAQNTEPDPTFTEVVYSRNAILSLLQMVALKSGV
ncbi:MAG: hypothetical protein FWD64_02770, partial [Acidobacteriaceae bacterium]|nr:hypothetical protein [Acidobacteriaceae bacterium]